MRSESESLLDEGEAASDIRNRNMEAQAEHERNKRYNNLYTLTTIFGLALIVLTFIWIVNHLGGFSLETPNQEFNWHPFLMVIGMLFLYSQSILVYRTGRKLQKNNLKRIHAAIHITIFILSAFALKAVFDSHNYAKPPIANLYSLHSWLGVLTSTLFCCQLLIGFVTFLYPAASKNVRTIILPYHTVLGTAGFIMAVVTCALGFMEKAVFALGNDYGDLPFGAVLVNLIGIVTVIFGVLTIHLVTDPNYKREELAEDEVALSG